MDEAIDGWALEDFAREFPDVGIRCPKCHTAHSSIQKLVVVDKSSAPSSPTQNPSGRTLLSRVLAMFRLRDTPCS